MAETLTQRMSVEEFLRLPETDEKLELVNGALERLMPPSYDHSRDQVRLGSRLLRYCEERQPRAEVLTELDVPTIEFSARRPDISYYSPEHRDRVERPGGRLLGPPTLCIECVSPGEESRDYEDKLLEYARAGVEHYWIVDRERHSVETYRLDGDRYQLAARFGRGETLTSPLLPGFELPLEELFVD